MALGQGLSRSENGVSPTVSLPRRIDSRPDYSSTTSESGDDASTFPETKFFLESDVPYPEYSLTTISDKSFNNVESARPIALDRSVYGKTQADKETYTRCIKCLRLHVPCDRKLPHCSRCTSTSECVYLKREGHKNQDEAVKTFLQGQSSQLREIYAGVKLTAKTEKVDRPMRSDPRKLNLGSMASPVNQTSTSSEVKTVTWLDGDVFHSQMKCPAPVLKQIKRHLPEFERSVAATVWPGQKTCYYDCGRALMFIDEITDQEVPVARYRYGAKRQFFVVWYPGEDQKLVPSIFRFKVYMNDPPIQRNGKSWKPVHWHTWVPIGTHHKPRVVLRYIEDKPSNMRFIPPAQESGVPQSFEAVEDRRPSLSGKKKMQDYGWSSASEGDVDIPHRPQQPKRARGSSITSHDQGSLAKRSKLQLWEENSKLRRERGTGGRFTGPEKSTEPANSLATRSSNRTSITHSKADHSAGFSIAGLIKKKRLDMKCVFEDRLGKVRGVFPYEECDTAQKLFEVACVTEIAQIEPPATRLLKVQFDSGGVSRRIRPDNNNDFDNVFQAELKEHIDSIRNVSAFRVVISPYL